MQENYSYLEAVEESWGTHATDEQGVLLDGKAMFGGLWTYEYQNTATGVFYPMTAYYYKTQTDGKCNWGNIYYSNKDAMWKTLPETYAVIGSAGKQIHPGNEAGVVITYVVPFTGVVAYGATLYAYDRTNTVDSQNGGTSVSLYRNDTRIWPVSEAESLFYYDKDQEKVISCDGISVNAGDKIRLVVSAAPGTTNSCKGCSIVFGPEITYLESEKYVSEIEENLPGEPPSGLAVDGITSGRAVLSWNVPDIKPSCYVVYVNGSVQRSVEEPTCTLEMLDPGAPYEVSVAFLNSQGIASEPGETVSFVTESLPMPETDTAVENTSSANVDPGSESFRPWGWIPVCAALAGILMMVIPVFLRKKQ